MHDLGTFGGNSYASAVNDIGQVVGESITPSNEAHAFRYSEGTMTDLGTLGGWWSGASDINDAGQVVGSALDAKGYLRAFLWEDGSMVDLNAYVVGTGWTLSGAGGINDWGDVCGSGTNPDGKTHGYVLRRTDISRTTSEPEPSLAGLLLLATVPALVVYRRRRQA